MFNVLYNKDNINLISASHGRGKDANMTRLKAFLLLK